MKEKYEDGGTKGCNRKKYKKKLNNQKEVVSFVEYRHGR